MEKSRIAGSAHSIQHVFTFLLIGLFAVMAVLLALSGTRIYREVTVTAAKNSDAQMLLSYIGNKVHAFDAQGQIEIGNENGISTLRLLETVDGKRYVTSLYAFQDAVWERFAPVDQPFEPANATRLTPAASLTFTAAQHSLLQATLVLADGATESIHVGLRAATFGEVD